MTPSEDPGCAPGWEPAGWAAVAVCFLATLVSFWWAAESRWVSFDWDNAQVVFIIERFGSFSFIKRKAEDIVALHLDDTGTMRPDDPRAVHHIHVVFNQSHLWTMYLGTGMNGERRKGDVYQCLVAGMKHYWKMDVGDEEPEVCRCWTR